MPCTEAQPTKERGRDLKGDGISYKCQIGHHKDCTAARCQCPCPHGQSAEIHIELPSGGMARVSPDIQPETVEALDLTMRAAVDYVRTQIDDLARTGHLQLERKAPGDDITLAGVTAGYLGRQGTGKKTR